MYDVLLRLLPLQWSAQDANHVTIFSFTVTFETKKYVSTFNKS